VNRDRPVGPGETKNPTREAQAETKAKSGPVRHVVQNGEHVADLPDLSWEEQREKSRRYNAKLLAIACNRIDSGLTTPADLPTTLSLFREATQTIKRFESPQSRDDGDSHVTPDERAQLDARLASSQ
jgi:hypothetical protein